MSEAPLFAANNHSAFEIAFRPAEVSLRQGLASALKEQYPFTSVDEESMGQVNEAEQASNNFRVEVVGEDGQPRVLLVRKNILLAEEDDVLFSVKTLTFLREQGLSVPHLIATRSGAQYATFEGSRWQVFDFIEGDHYAGKLEELLSAGRGIAALHRVLSTFPFVEELKHRRQSFQPFSEQGLEKVLEAAARNQDELDATLLGHAATLRTMASVRNRFQVAGAREQVVHGDLHPHNTIFSNGQLRAMLDFDMLQYGELLRDVGFAAHRFSRQYAVCVGGGAEQAALGFQQFLKAYREEYPLTDDEVRSLPFFMLDELLRRIVTDFSRYYFEGVTRFANVRELEKKVTLLREAEYLSSYVTA